VKKYLEILFLSDSGKCLSIHHKAAVTIDSTCTCLGSQISQLPWMIKLPSFIWFHLIQEYFQFWFIQKSIKASCKNCVCVQHRNILWHTGPKLSTNEARKQETRIL